MPNEKITKRTVSAAAPADRRYAIYDSGIPGFGLRVHPTGQKTWIFDYWPGEGGRSTVKKRVTIGVAAYPDPKKQPDFTADAARKEAEQLRAVVLQGGDPQGSKTAKRLAPTVETVARAFLDDVIVAESTKAYYTDLIERIIIPELGKLKAKDAHSGDWSRLHKKLKDRPFLANRVLAVGSAIYSYGQGPARMVPKGANPTTEVRKYDEPKRDRLLSADELERLGAAMREAETTGIPWTIDPTKQSKHLPKANRATIIAPAAVAALRLLILTGARLREILNLRWDQVDLERGLFLLPAHKTSRKTGIKTIVLNAPAIEVLSSIERIGVFVVAGDSAGRRDEKPRSDLKRPWALVTRRAGLEGLRIHDLRHNFASFGVGGGMGLPVIGKLLGHVQASTTQRYSHLDNDPLKRASNTIATAIAAAMGDALPAVGNVVALPKGKRGG